MKQSHRITGAPWRGLLGLGVGICGAFSGTAHAQTAAATSGTDPSAGLEEIVITAQRREESLQHAALAVTAVTAEELTLRDVTMAEDLTRVVPSVAFSTGGGGSSQVSLRGVGALTGNALAEQVVAFNLNGVYLPRSGGSNGMFFDLQRIEVLKGPQGTLYGRNATAGAINLVAAQPDHEFGGNASVRVGNYGLVQGEAALNLPLSDTVALRLAGQSIKRDGYFSDGYSDADQYSGRASLLVEPSSTLSLLVVTDYEHVGDKGPGQVLSAPFIDPSNPYLGPSSPQTVAYYQNTPPVSFLESPPTANGFNDTDLFGVSGTLNWQVGDGTFTLIPAYRRSRFFYSTPTPGFRLDDDEMSTTKSVEARYATASTHRLHGVVGVYYFDDGGNFDIDTYITDLVSGPDPTHVSDFNTRAVAGFGQATFDLTEKVRLIGGLRYSQEKKTVEGTIHAPPAPIAGDVKFDRLTYRAGVEADLAPQSLGYFTYATGFKAGGFYTAAVPNTFKPEFLNAWTLGSKNRFNDNRVQLNAEAFYWDYKDKQVNHLGPINPGGFSLITENAGQATLYGLELDSEFLLTPHDKLSATVMYEHARYGSYVVNVSPTRPSSGCGITQVNPITYTVDCSGNEIALAPRWSGSMNYAHTFALTNGGNVVFAISGLAKSRYWTGDDHVPGEEQAGYLVGDLNLNYNAAAQRWSVGAFVNNVSNRVVSSFAFVHPLFGRPMAQLGDPRTFGANASYRF